MRPEAIKLVGLLKETSVHYVVPVFQRAYAWEETHCEQLWNDILSVAHRNVPTHFTGSVVLVQGDTMRFESKTPCLIIDGQQRLTTVTLLIIALARYARSHKDAGLPFSDDEIIDDRYLLDKRRRGDDRYALTLSQGDRDVLRAIEENLVNPDAPLPAGPSRLITNLSFFEKRLAGLRDVGMVWNGLRRLQVISISLSQGIDDPQLIFESMNSTGKDLASSDLIRNFVLMRKPQPEQTELYETYWRPIEETLGAQTYDKVFDEFVRWWLTSIKAEAVSRKDIYQTFKNYAFDNGFVDEADGMERLLKDMGRYATYFANITQGTEKDPVLKEALQRVDELNITVSRALLLFLYDARDAGRFSSEDFTSMARTLESYIIRRIACSDSAGLNKFFPTLIGRLKTEDATGADFVKTFETILLAETAKTTYFPSDEEFKQRLETMNVYTFKMGGLLLKRLENSYHPKEPRAFAGYTIEHIMPQNALKHAEWRRMIAPDANQQELEGVFERHLHTLGNLTLTAYNSELSDATFAEKRERAVGGYNNDIITISQTLRDIDEWTPAKIEERGAYLAKRAAEIWPRPSIPVEEVSTRRGNSRTESTPMPKLKDLVSSGVLPIGSKLYSVSRDAPGTATILENGKLKLDGLDEVFSTLNKMTTRNFERAGKKNDRNAWTCWRYDSPNGPLLKEVRSSSAR